MIVTRMSLPRRTFLRGAGAALALPLLDAMVPAATALARTAATPDEAARLHLHPERRQHVASGHRPATAPSSCRRF